VENNVIADPIVFEGSPAGDGKSASYRNDNAEIQEILGRSGNVVVSGDPGFVDAARGDLRLKPDSPAWKLGFERIPVEKMGLRLDEYRRALPAVTPRIATPPQLFFEELLVRLEPSLRGPKSVLRYTLDGSEPTARSPIYKAPIRLKAPATVVCAAWPAGGPDDLRSQSVRAAYRMGKLGPEGGVYLSDLPEAEYAGYYPELKKDVAHGGQPLSLGGHTHARGLLTHPGQLTDGNRGQVTYALTGALAKARRFTARIGIEDQAPRDTPGWGTCAFAVEVRRGGDWQRVFESPVMKAGDAPRDVDVDLSGADRLRLNVTDGGDGISWDHAVWADALIR